MSDKQRRYTVDIGGQEIAPQIQIVYAQCVPPPSIIVHHSADHRCEPVLFRVRVSQVLTPIWARPEAIMQLDMQTAPGPVHVVLQLLALRRSTTTVDQETRHKIVSRFFGHCCRGCCDSECYIIITASNWLTGWLWLTWTSDVIRTYLLSRSPAQHNKRTTTSNLTQYASAWSGHSSSARAQIAYIC